MWIKMQDGTRLNADHLVTVASYFMERYQKDGTPHNYYRINAEEVKTGSCYVIASQLTQAEADELLEVLTLALVTALYFDTTEALAEIRDQLAAGEAEAHEAQEEADGAAH